MNDLINTPSELIRDALIGSLVSALPDIIEEEYGDIAATALLEEFEARGILLLVPTDRAVVVGDADEPEPNYIETTLVTTADKHGDTTLRLEVAGEDQFISVKLSPSKLATLFGYGEPDARTVATLRADHRYHGFREGSNGTGEQNLQFARPGCPLCNGTEAA